MSNSRSIKSHKKTDMWHYDKPTLQLCEDERMRDKSDQNRGMLVYASRVVEEPCRMCSTGPGDCSAL